MIKLVRKPVSSFFGATLPNENTEVAGAAIHYDHYKKTRHKNVIYDVRVASFFCASGRVYR